MLDISKFADFPMWTKTLAAIWVILTFSLIMILLFYKPKQENEKDGKQKNNLESKQQPIIDTTINKPPLDESVSSSKSDTTKNITINDSPGSIATIDQEGDNIIINPKVDIPEPHFEFQILSENVPTGEHFKSEALLTIESKTQINNLYLEARAPSIISFEVRPQRTGMSMSGHTGKRDGFAFTNIPNAWGKYKLILISKHPDKFEIIYNYE